MTSFTSFGHAFRKTPKRPAVDSWYTITEYIQVTRSLTVIRALKSFSKWLKLRGHSRNEFTHVIGSLVFIRKLAVRARGSQIVPLLMAFSHGEE